MAGQWTDSISRLVATASDEQLAGIVGPDSEYYSSEAVAAAEAELGRRTADGGEGDVATFNTAAMALGPFWYIYNGMVGRGAILFAVLAAAIAGLEPVARTLGIPSELWIAAVVFAVALYSGRFGDRDLAESRRARSGVQGRQRPVEDKAVAEADATRDSAPPLETTPAKGNLEVVARVRCRTAAEAARRLLRTQGIDAVVMGGEPDEARVLVPSKAVVQARAIIQQLLARVEEEKICEEPDDRR